MNPSSPKPAIMCLVGYPLKQGHVWPIGGTYVELAKAVHYKNLGYVVLVDPQTEAELARWEQLNRDK